MRHVLVVANETVAGESLIKSLREHAEGGAVRVTVVCPISQPRHGTVVYEDTRRASAGAAWTARSPSCATPRSRPTAWSSRPIR